MTKVKFQTACCRNWTNPCAIWIADWTCSPEHHRKFKHKTNAKSIRKGNKNMSSEEFRAGMRKLTGGVTIITSMDAEGNRCGLTATAVCSLSTEPPSLLACVNRSSSVAAVVESSGVFAVNVLSLDQQPVAEVFAGRAGLVREERFAAGEWIKGIITGAPVLSQTCVSFECEIAEVKEFGTHLILIGTVAKTHCASEDDNPLIYGNGAFLTAAVPPQAAA